MFKKKKVVRIEPIISTLKPTHQDIKNQLFNFFYQHNQLHPIYVRSLTSYKDADQNSDILPLVYIWNERSTSKGLEFELSVNGRIVGEILENYLPRSSPDFGVVRDSFMLDMAGIVQESSIETCNKVGKPPSMVFAPHVGEP